MNEKFTIITISLNAEKAIKGTLESVLKQRYRPLEYILVDGASTDRTNEIIQGYIEKFNTAGIEIKHVSEKDSGISDAFNKGISMATGGLIGILNAGDAYNDEVLTMVADAADENDDVLCGDIIWCDSNRGIEYVRKSSSNWSELKHRMSIMHPSCFVKKRTYVCYGGYDCNYKYAMDYELLARFYNQGARFRYLSVPIARMRADGISDKGNPNMYRELQKILISNGNSNIHAFWNVWVLKIRNDMAQFIKNTKPLRMLFLWYKGR